MVGKTLAVAAAITGGLLAVSSPVSADAADARNVPTHQGVAAVGAGDPDGRCRHCRTGPPGPQGPPGPRGRADGISSVYATPTGGVPAKYLGLAQGNGTTLVRDPTSVASNPFWHDVSTLPGYPGGVTDVSLTVPPVTPNQLHITVRSITGKVAQATCLLSLNVTWPGNCGAFADFTPPL
ncbi:hypothetical protein [Sphaerisporangium rubeum]|uniref:Collagen-like protein n=1 Tax=Sphaerisporangium rubeum TaxID=321317 RepID=A0A7X0ICR9_9ACTN|nr:hypothetical protein [Sphaerisporangium rubeum]MBB6472756.1 hypothetical protein [Sphaerisporangium rubeum]